MRDGLAVPPSRDAAGSAPFGALLRQARLTAGLSQEELAEHSGISVRAIAYLESGHTRKPYRQTLRRLADALRLDIDARDQWDGTVRMAPGARPALWRVPAQLPHDIPGFTGRDSELAALCDMHDQADGVLPIVAIDGTAGVGKTALAVHWAHRMTPCFPDGQLYVGLRGFHPVSKPLDPAEAIGGFLDALEVPLERRPTSLDAQSGLYRTLLAGRRVLVVLDNALDEQQVRPLLPGSAACLVLVTSRRQLSGLVASDGASALTVQPLSDAAAYDLLARRLGTGRLRTEARAASELIELCAGLPLALAVIAARVAANPGLPLTEFASELRTASRLTALDAGDVATSVRAAFSCTCDRLSSPAVRLFRLLGLPPAVDFAVQAIAAMAGLPCSQVRKLMRELARASLLREHVPGRFVMHDLLRVYAAEQADASEATEARRAALAGLLDFYLAAAAAAMDVLLPSERHHRPLAPTLAKADHPATPVAARAWLDTERANLVAVTDFAAAHGFASRAVRLAATLFRYLDMGGYSSDAMVVHTSALRAARDVGDRVAEANSLRSLGASAWRRSQYAEAERYFQQALDLYRERGDDHGHALTLHNLGLVLSRLGNYDTSISSYRRALAIFRAAGDGLYTALTLDHIGTVLRRQARYRQAAVHHRRALAIFRELGNQFYEAAALDNIGIVCDRQGRYSLAARYHRMALALCRETGGRQGEAETLDNLGRALRGLGHHDEAADHHGRALTLFHESGNRSGEARALNSMGETLTAAGQPGQACGKHEMALTVATEIGDREEQARAHQGLAGAYLALGDAREGRRHTQQAEGIYSALGVPASPECAGRPGSRQLIRG